jgi:hypothetical protein
VSGTAHPLFAEIPSKFIPLLAAAITLERTTSALKLVLDE